MKKFEITYEFEIEIRNERRTEGNYSLYCCDNGHQWWYMGLTYRSEAKARAVKNYLLESKA